MNEIEGINCRSCGWPMEPHEKYCGRCGSSYKPKKEDPIFGGIESTLKVIVFIIVLPFAIIGAVIGFPIGTIGAIAIVGGMWHYWFGAGRNLKKCRCCNKEISKEAQECPKCGCPRPIY